MKKFKSIIALIVVIYGCLFATSNVKALTLSTPETSQTIDSNSSGTITLKFDEKVKSFKTFMKYDPDVIEIEESDSKSTYTVNPKYSDGVASLVYMPTAETSEDTFTINIKTKEVTKEEKSEINFASVTAVSEKDGTEQELDKTSVYITVKPVKTNENNQEKDSSAEKEENVATPTDDTTSDTKLSKTGGSDMILALIIASVVAAMVFKMKSKRMKKLFIMLPILVAVATFGGKDVEAATSTATGEFGEGKFRIDFIDIESSTKYIGVSQNKDSRFDFDDAEKEEVLKSDLNAFLEKNSLTKFDSSDKTVLKTGDKIGDYTLVIYSDIDKDGILHDNDDWNIYKNHFLTSNKIKDEIDVLAGDINMSGSIDLADMFRIRNKIIGYDGGGAEGSKNELGDTLIAIKTLKASIDKNSIAPDETAKITVHINPLTLVKNIQNETTTVDISLGNLTKVEQKPITDDGNIEITVKGTEIGDNKITIKVDGLTASVNCTVKEKTPDVKLHVKYPIEVGETSNITAEPAMPTTGTITYKSSDESVATVNENGLVTAIKPGDVEISIEVEGFNGIIAPVKTTVISKQFDTNSLEWGDYTKSLTSLEVGAESEALDVKYGPSDAAKPTITWSIKDDANTGTTIDSKTGVIKAGSKTGKVSVTVTVTADVNIEGYYKNASKTKDISIYTTE